MVDRITSIIVNNTGDIELGGGAAEAVASLIVSMVRRTTDDDLIESIAEILVSDPRKLDAGWYDRDELLANARELAIRIEPLLKPYV